MSFGDAVIDVIVWGIAIFILGGLLLMGVVALPIILVIAAIALIIWIANSDSAGTVIGIGIVGLFVLFVVVGVVESWKDRKDPSRRQGWCRVCMKEVSASFGTVNEHLGDDGRKCPGTNKPRATPEERAKHLEIEAEVAEYAARRAARVANAEAAVKAADAAKAKVAAARGPKPMNRLIRTPHDAEVVAAKWMQWMGFSGARATPVGADSGIDVMSAKAIAQVKMEGIATGRPVIQNAYGVGQAEGKRALVFSLGGYTAQALEWANNVDMPLFRFDLQGTPEPSNGAARKLLERGS